MISDSKAVFISIIELTVVAQKYYSSLKKGTKLVTKFNFGQSLKSLCLRQSRLSLCSALNPQCDRS